MGIDLCPVARRGSLFTEGAKTSKMLLKTSGKLEKSKPKTGLQIKRPHAGVGGQVRCHRDKKWVDDNQ